MRVLESVQFERIGALSRTTMGPLSDLTVIVGPNNCGKTTALRALSHLSKARLLDDQLECPCQHVVQHWNTQELNRAFRHQTLQARGFSPEERPAGSRFPNSVIHVTPAHIPQLTLPTDVQARAARAVQETIAQHAALGNTTVANQVSEHIPNPEVFLGRLSLRDTHSGLRSAHFSPFNMMGAGLESSLNFVHIDSNRLATINGMTYKDYTASLNPDSQVLAKVGALLSTLADKNISGLRYGDLNVVSKLTPSISLAFNGSGVRSLFALLLDLMGSPEGSVVLIDEPEVGLSPHSKALLMECLVLEAERCQVLLTTHDPAVLGPLARQVALAKTKVSLSIFMHTPLPSSDVIGDNPRFIRVNPQEFIRRPDTYAGCLPHPESRCVNHIYVEGPNDVVAVRKALLEALDNDLERFCEYSVFHMEGDNWAHYLATIPTTLETVLVLLDSDKVGVCASVIDAYRHVSIIMNKPVLCSSPSRITKRLAMGERNTLVTCLENGCVEDQESRGEVITILKAFTSPRA